MTASDTQLESWVKLWDELSFRQANVYEIIQRRGGCTSREIATALHLPLHSVSGRITELCQAGRVKDSGRRAYDASTNRRLTVWEISPIDPRLLTKER